MPGYLFILVLLAVLWLFLVRPRQRQLRDQRRQLSQIEVGDEIVTAGGLYGTVQTIEDDELHVEIAPQVVVRMARRAVAGVLTERADTETDAAETDVEEPEQLQEETGANLPEP
ncbi:MAG: preprotein translocase subunit YajC [Gaiellaceae bacterium]|jgi:preprotein translocase subunit YajC|nr:preprotein translocase subunit YajC [Acidobacteriota bacterium]